MNLLPNLVKISFLLLLLLVPEVAPAGIFSMKLDTRVAPAPGRLVAVSTVANNGEETVYNVSVTSSLASDTRRSDSLGDIPAGKRRKQRVEFNPESIKPGRYILVTRLDFHEQNGLPHRIYSFHPFRVDRKEPEKQESQGTLETKPKSGISGATETPGLSVSVEIPPVRRKAFGSTDIKMSLLLKNTQNAPLQPVFSLQLPDGVTADREEILLDMSPGEERREEMRLKADQSVRGGHPVSVLVRYETENEHDSRLLRTTLAVDENPEFLSGIVIAAIIMLIAVSVAAIFAFRRRSAGATGKTGT